MSGKHKKETFLETAKRQLEQSCIPTCVAISASVVISKLGLPLIVTGGAMASAYAYWKGYRVRLVKPTEESDETND